MHINIGATFMCIYMSTHMCDICDIDGCLIIVLRVLLFLLKLMNIPLCHLTYPMKSW